MHTESKNRHSKSKHQGRAHHIGASRRRGWLSAGLPLLLCAQLSGCGADSDLSEGFGAFGGSEAPTSLPGSGQ